MSREAFNSDQSNGQTAPVAMPDGEPPAARKRPGRPRKVAAAPVAEPTPPATRRAKAPKVAKAPEAMKALGKAERAEGVVVIATKPRPAAPEPDRSPMTAAFDQVAKDVQERLLGAKATAKQRAALNYTTTTQMAQAVEARRNQAKQQAIKAGVLPDTDAAPFPVGTSEVVYSDKLLSIGMKVVAQASRTDVLGLIADLQQAGVKPSLLKRLMRKHSKVFNGAHIFTPAFS